MNTLQEYTPFDLGVEYFGNTVGEYLLALLTFIGLGIVLRAVQWLILRRLAALAEKTATDIDDILIKIVKSLKPGFYVFVAFFFAVQPLTLTELGGRVLNGILAILLLLTMLKL